MLYPAHHSQKEFQFVAEERLKFYQSESEKFTFFAPDEKTAVRYANQWAKEHGLMLVLVKGWGE